MVVGPEVGLEVALAGGGAGIGRVGAARGGEGAAGGEGGVVDGFEDGDVEVGGWGRGEGEVELGEDVGEALDADG